MVHQFFLDRRPHNGMKYQEYIVLLKQKIELINKNNLSEYDGISAMLLKLNYQRSIRIEKNYIINKDLCELIKKIRKPQLWLLISEHWCGDSAQIIPYISKFVECNNLIDLRILERDKNIDIMDLYLTNGTRSIPKLIAFDYEGNELFQWGPRPKEAQDLVNKLKFEGKSKEELMEQLHAWYAKDQGKTIEKEFYKIISDLI